MARLLSIALLWLAVMTILASINARGLRSADRRKLAFQYFIRKRFDIICLQETYWSEDLEMQIKREWDGDSFFAHGTENSRGVGILIHSRLEHSTRHVECDNEGRIVNILLDIDDHTLNIVNVYAPNTDTERRAFFTVLDRFLSSEFDNIVAGDFNCIMEAKLDKLGGNPNPRNSAVASLNTIKMRYGLCDIWRFRHRNERNFTWTGKSALDNSVIRTRIDFFLTSKTVDQFVTSVITPYAHSDHDCICLTFDFDQIKRGPGYWHFNNDLLKDPLFQADVERFWGCWQSKLDDFDDPLKWWDRAKQEFKVIAIRRAKIRRKLQGHERFKLERELDRLQEQAVNGTTRDIERYLSAKEKLRQLELVDLEAIKVRTKARFIEEGERSTRYFFSLEKSRRADQTIRVLTKESLDTVSDTKGLLSESYAFYKKLYSAEEGDEEAQEVFLNDALPRLPDDACELCEGELSEEELRIAALSMENDKSPGIDGLTSNFYKHFWPLFGNSLTRVFNYAFLAGRLSVSQRRGIITLLFKKGDRTLLKNWRPITLLTSDYKILTKALANRLHKVLPLIVHSDQTASIKGRTINDNTRLLHDVITYANEENVPLALISVDQLKAFDRVAHGFLFKTLERFGFGPSFLRWIQVIYNSVSSSVKTNGWFTAFIGLERGLRQGCSLSMPLYVLSAETLAVNIRNNPRIHGIIPPNSNTELKLSQFADDTTLLVTDDDSIIESFSVFDCYERASGAKINKGKCKGLWCGAFSQRTEQLHDFDWYNDFIPEKILGQYFGNVDCSQINWETKIQKINNVIGVWQHRDLSLKGRALLINSLLTSTLWYNVISLSVPSWACAQIEQAIYGFFWNNKHPLVNRDILALPLSEGGFNIPRLETKIQAFRMNTLKRLLTPEDAHWKNFTAHFLRVANMKLGKMTLALNYSLQNINRDIPSFHQELLRAWYKHSQYRTRSQTPVSVSDILKEPLFLNGLITSRNRTLIYGDWIKAGIIQVKDICYEIVPGFLRASAIHELISDDHSGYRPLSTTARELNDLLDALPKEWCHQISTSETRNQPTLQPVFSIVNPNPGHPPTDIVTCKTRDFYHQLHQPLKPVVPSIDYWESTLQPAPSFNAKQWRALYSPLVSNKMGDVNWKIAHRVIVTGLSLQRMRLQDSGNCLRCGETDTVEDAFLDCLTVVQFWIYTKTFIDKISSSKLQLTRTIRLLGKFKRSGEPISQNHVNLINCTLSVARFSIYKSAVNHRLHNVTVPPAAIFASIVKSHLRFQFKLYSSRQTLLNFEYQWCLAQAFAKVENDHLVFTF